MIDNLTILDPNSGRVSVDNRHDAIATISAGYFDKHADRPMSSRDGKIYLQHDGRASGLEAALEKTKYKELTIALVHEPNAGGFIQKFTRYTKSKLEVVGDENSLTVINPRKTHLVGTPEYDALVKTCKAETFIYFTLAEWADGRPQVVFPDGFALYRLRFTSRHSAIHFVNQMNATAKFTGGRVAGIPFTLSIQYPTVIDPTGAKRNPPIWSFTMKPPATMTLGARQIQEILSLGVGEVSALALPAPELTNDDIERDQAIEMDDEDVRNITVGTVDKAAMCRTFFAVAKGSPLDGKESDARKAFVKACCHEFGVRETDSLSEFFDRCDPYQALEIIARASDIKDHVTVVVDPEPVIDAEIVTDGGFVHDSAPDESQSRKESGEVAESSPVSNTESEIGAEPVDIKTHDANGAVPAGGAPTMPGIEMPKIKMPKIDAPTENSDWPANGMSGYQPENQVMPEGGSEAGTNPNPEAPVIAKARERVMELAKKMNWPPLGHSAWRPVFDRVAMVVHPAIPNLTEWNRIIDWIGKVQDQKANEPMLFAEFRKAKELAAIPEESKSDGEYDAFKDPENAERVVEYTAANERMAIATAFMQQLKLTKAQELRIGKIPGWVDVVLECKNTQEITDSREFVSWCENQAKQEVNS